MTRTAALRILAHVIAVITLGGVVAQLVVAAQHEPKNLVFGAGIFLLTLTALVAGWVIAVRRPANALGWLLMVIALFFGLQGYAVALATALAGSAPTAVAWLDWYGGDNEWSWLPPVGLLFTQVPLRFPDGRLPSSGWRWFSRYTIVAIVVASVVNMTFGTTVGARVPNPTYVDWGGATTLVTAVALGSLGVAMIVSIASLGVRYRHAGPVQRAQLRWVYWAAAVVMGIVLGGALEQTIFGDASAPGIRGTVALVWLVVSSVAYSLIPLSILFAVLRRGLYSIDRIISRTAAYAVVTAAVVALYAAIIVLGSLLIPNLEAVGVAVATLAAAAVFLPLLRVVRRTVDRRFNRSQYDAQKVVDSFGERIRTGADPHSAGVDLVGAVEHTLQPAAVGLWMPEAAR